MEHKHIVIFTGGKFYDKFAASYLNEHPADCFIAADHGLEAARRLGIRCDILIGDFDSADPEAFADYCEFCHPKIVKHPPEKDWTDTELAIHTACDMGASEITLLGASGTRIDHMLGTIHTLKIPLDYGIPCLVVDPWNRIRMISSGISIRRDEQFGNFVSLVPFTEEVTGLTLRGMKYDLENYKLTQGNSLGISNEIAESEGMIEFESGILLVIESADRPEYTE